MTASNTTAEINPATSNVSSFKDDLSVSELPSLFRKKGNPKRGKKHLGQTSKSTKWLTLFVRMKITEGYWFLSIHKTSLNVTRWENEKRSNRARLRRQKTFSYSVKQRRKNLTSALVSTRLLLLRWKKPRGFQDFKTKSINLLCLINWPSTLDFVICVKLRWLLNHLH